MGKAGHDPSCFRIESMFLGLAAFVDIATRCNGQHDLFSSRTCIRGNIPRTTSSECFVIMYLEHRTTLSRSILSSASAFLVRRPKRRSPVVTLRRLLLLLFLGGILQALLTLGYLSSTFDSRLSRGKGRFFLRCNFFSSGDLQGTLRGLVPTYW